MASARLYCPLLTLTSSQLFSDILLSIFFLHPSDTTSVVCFCLLGFFAAPSYLLLCLVIFICLDVSFCNDRDEPQNEHDLFGRKASPACASDHGISFVHDYY
jgi:hypothetical protein